MNALELRNVGSVEIAIAPSAAIVRDDAIAAAGWVAQVASHAQFGAAAEALKGLRSVAKSVEVSRTAIKAPVLDLGKKIDATAKAFVAEVDQEITRLTGLMTQWEVEQRRLAAEAERQRQEEERRRQAEEAARIAEITRQQQAAARAELLANTERERAAAEAQRIAAELAAAIERAAAAERQANLPVVVEPPKVAGTVVEAKLAEIRRQQEAAARAEMLANTEAERAAAEARCIAAEVAAAAEREAAAARAAVVPVVIQAPKVAGTVVREEWTFDVTDLRAFAQAHPDLVEITVRRADVLKMIRGGCRQLSHARIYTETKVGVRV